MSAGPFLSPKPEPGDRQDGRVYLPNAEGWEAHVQRDAEKTYCYLQNPGEDYFHLILDGEVYLQRGPEKYCLNCALRHGYLTRDRLHWQRRGRSKKDGSL